MRNVITTKPLVTLESVKLAVKKFPSLTYNKYTAFVWKVITVKPLVSLKVCNIRLGEGDRREMRGAREDP